MAIITFFVHNGYLVNFAHPLQVFSDPENCEAKNAIFWTMPLIFLSTSRKIFCSLWTLQRSYKWIHSPHWYVNNKLLWRLWKLDLQMYFKIGHLQMLALAVVMHGGLHAERFRWWLRSVSARRSLPVPSLPVQLVAPCAGHETIRSVTMVALVRWLQIQIQIHHICNRSPDLIRREN